MRLFRNIFLYSLIFALTGSSAVVLGQESPPAPGPPRQINLPQPVDRTLKNGMRVVVIEDHDAPLMTVKVLVKNGGEIDPPELSGLSQMTASLLTKGTKTRSATETVQAIEALGGEIGSGADWDYAQAAVTVISDKVVPAVEVLADVVQNPAFKDDEIERLRQQTLDGLEVSLSQPGEIANLVAARVVFGGSPYGASLAGTPAFIARIKREDIVRLHSRTYTPSNAILVFSGDIKADVAFKLAARVFGPWAGSGAVAQATTGPAPAKRAGSRVVVIDMPNSGQAAVVLARRGIERRDPDYYRGLVANSVLGGGYSSRLNQEVRIKRGLSYGAGSQLSARRLGGVFMASTQTKNESAVEVASLFLSELDRLASAPLPETELQPRRATLVGNYGLALETTDGLATRTAFLALYEIPFSEINGYLKQVQAVTESEVRKFAAERLKSSEADIIIVGESKLFLEALRKQFPNVEVIGKDQLDLDSVDLKKSVPAGK